MLKRTAGSASNHPIAESPLEIYPFNACGKCTAYNHCTCYNTFTGMHQHQLYSNSSVASSSTGGVSANTQSETKLAEAASANTPANIFTVNHQHITYNYPIYHHHHATSNTTSHTVSPKSSQELPLAASTASGFTCTALPATTHNPHYHHHHGNEFFHGAGGAVETDLVCHNNNYATVNYNNLIGTPATTNVGSLYAHHHHYHQPPAAYESGIVTATAAEPEFINYSQIKHISASDLDLNCKSEHAAALESYDCAYYSRESKEEPAVPPQTSAAVVYDFDASVGVSTGESGSGSAGTFYDNGSSYGYFDNVGPNNLSKSVHESAAFHYDASAAALMSENSAYYGHYGYAAH